MPLSDKPGCCGEPVQRRELVLAEPHTLYREALAHFLSSTGGFRILAQCADGIEAGAAIRKHDAACAVVDITLPRLNTVQLITRLHDEGLRCRFLVLYFPADRPFLRDALLAGARGFLPKSAPAQDLLEVIDLVLAGGFRLPPGLFPPKEPGGPAPALAPRLSPREQGVLRLLVEGWRTKEIALRLELSPKTVDAYRASLMRKLGVTDLPALVKYALRHQMASGLCPDCPFATVVRCDSVG